MLKQVLKNSIRAAGYEIRRINPPQAVEEPFFKFSEKDLDFYETPIGKYYLPNNAPQDIIIHMMKHGQYFEPEIIAVAERYIRPETSVLDIGANLGQMTLRFSELVGPQGEVYSFEADDYIFEVLRKNIHVNSRKNITPLFGAVYDTSNKILHFPKQDFVRFPAYGSYGIDPNSTNGREVRTLTIDELDLDMPISFMKVDVQGSDLHAMRGARETIARHKMPILFEYEQQFQCDFKTSFQDYVNFVDEIGYRFEEVVDKINYLVLPKNNNLKG